MNPVVFNLSLHRWQLFLTLTFDSHDRKTGAAKRVPKEADRRKMLFAFLHEAREGLKRSKETGRRIEVIPWDELMWVAREERGELNGRHHFHILLDGIPSTRMNHTERFVLKAIWNSLGGGFADVRMFDTRLSGVRYVLKGLEGWSQRNANSYEIRKFDEGHEDRTLIVAKACLEKWGRRTKQRASERTQPDISAVSLLAGRKPGAHKRAKETPEELEARIRSSWLNAHPAGVSFVR